jgi:hypothetical protein
MTDTLVAEPFLLRYATRRLDQPEIPGRYSPEASVWVVETEEGERPVVDVASHGFGETQTKTMTQQESDDDDLGRGAASETGTYTKVRQEADDEDATLCLPELQTKTDIQQESDDQLDPPV